MIDSKSLIDEIVTRYERGRAENIPSHKLGLAKNRGKMIDTIYVDMGDEQGSIKEHDLVDTVGDDLGKSILSWIQK